MSSEECLSFVVSPGSINSCGCIVLYRPVLVLLVLWLMVVFSCPPSELSSFLLLAAAFLHLVFLLCFLWPVLRFSQQTSVCVGLVG